MFMGNVFSIIALYSILTCAEIILSIKFDYPSSNATQFWRGGEEVNVPSVGGDGGNRQLMYPDAGHTYLDDASRQCRRNDNGINKMVP
mmetsp:Transcript_19805/g.29222  ORF Transcript_19805/g.29222 Transcript_19805/m.29222 type:complete len:88 (-) Transcript_19805:203-466(-)